MASSYRSLGAREDRRCDHRKALIAAIAVIMASVLNAGCVRSDQQDERKTLYEDIIASIEEANRYLKQASEMWSSASSSSSGAAAAVGIDPMNNLNSTLVGADTISGSSSACVPRMHEVATILNSVETGLLQDHVKDAELLLQVAMDVLSSCLDTFSPPSDLRPQHNDIDTSAENDINEQLTGQTNSIDDYSVPYFLKQAYALLEAASTSFTKLESLQETSISSTSIDKELVSDESTMVEPEGWRGGHAYGGGCKRDGTICQFSSCGQGKLLPVCAFGFAYGVTGGAKGPIYVVTRSDDNPHKPVPGSLRYAVGLGGGPRGVWITFASSMIIELQSMLWLKSHTTLDGRGANVTITGRMLVVGGVTNVIVHNLQVNSMDESDTIHIFAGSSKVWVDHVTSFDAKLGLISVVQRATDVTISNSQLSNPNFNMLLGASDADVVDKNMRVTVYRNWFKDSNQRMPHCRWGYCHVVNNLYTNWGYYAIGGRVHAKIFSESNVFIAGRRSEVTPWFPGAGVTPNFDSSPVIQSRNDLLLNGTTFHQFGHTSPSSSSAAASAALVVVRPPYRNNNAAASSKSSAAYPALLPNLRALPDLIRACSGADFGSRLQRCLRTAHAINL